MEIVLVHRAILVAHGRLDLRGDILVERSAKPDIDDLQAAANAEDGLAGGHERAHEFDFVRVARSVSDPLGPQGLLAVGSGPDIRAAMHDKAVQPLRIIFAPDRAARGFTVG